MAEHPPPTTLSLSLSLSLSLFFSSSLYVSLSLLILIELFKLIGIHSMSHVGQLCIGLRGQPQGQQHDEVARVEGRCAVLRGGVGVPRELDQTQDQEPAGRREGSC